MPSFRAIFILAALSNIPAGCGYSQSSFPSETPEGYQWKSLYRQDIKTVAVPTFTTRTFERNVEFNLTKAVVNQIEAQTPYKVVPKERADTILEAEVTRADIDKLSDDNRTSLPQEQLLTLRVNFIWKDLRTGRILVERKAFEQSASYYPTLGEGRFVGAQLNVERLALAIVQELQADW